MGKQSPERSRSGEEVRELMEWAVAARRRPLREDVRRRAALILADDIGAMVAGSQENQVVAAQAKVLADAAPRAEAHVFAAGVARCDRYTAAVANGLAVTWCELDEGFRNASCHAGAYTLPALLAEAEVRGPTVEALLRDIAIAYEVTTRFALAFPFPRFTVHPHAAFPTIGAAAGSAVARRLDAQAMLRAVCGAASMTYAGHFDTAVEGALVRNAWTGVGAWIGLRAADWADCGIGGLATSPYDTFTDCLSTEYRPGAMVEALGERWSVSNGYHKVFACCGYAHAAVEATLELLGRLGERTIDDVAEVEIATSPGGMALTTVKPETVLAAKFSIPHSVAATMVIRDAGRRAFVEDTLTDPRIARLREAIRLVLHPDIRPWPNDRPAKVTWRFRDGTVWTAACDNARGGADQPFDDEALFGKLRDNAEAVFPAMPRLLWSVVEGDPATLARPWPALAAALTGPAR
ncbi:MmgE/PrpD family protein [Bosea sp. (in: a-proteobacteria)]|uniref:MmgE/PrpD family protein n=1 Tax=Bosea sp. (in: a-proteobacteria) TaxID=1871050 RepID=UPI0026069843|nr:MmgE/PrpD family protein [Bosea sp. (in: a-proteobacteria)]MCO5090592.1 MmgE/PrpD family protein [Bosea sp. (in: a-proteobacteria)]